jgi:hypothetical protein
MKQRLICITIICAFIACTPKEKEIPADIMPVNKMKLIVWDMAQAGAYASYLKENDSATKVVNTGYLAEVLKLYNISKADFYKSFNFYQQHPVLNKELFDSVSAYAQRQKSEIYKKHQ